MRGASWASSSSCSPISCLAVMSRIFFPPWSLRFQPSPSIRTAGPGSGASELDDWRLNRGMLRSRDHPTKKRENQTGAGVSFVGRSRSGAASCVLSAATPRGSALASSNRCVRYLSACGVPGGWFQWSGRCRPPTRARRDMAFKQLRRLMGEGSDQEAEAETDVDITFGIEEEFFLVDPESRDIIADPDAGIFEVCEQNRGTPRRGARVPPFTDRDQYPRVRVGGRPARRAQGNPPDRGGRPPRNTTPR